MKRIKYFSVLGLFILKLTSQAVLLLLLLVDIVYWSHSYPVLGKLNKNSDNKILYSSSRYSCTAEFLLF